MPQNGNNASFQPHLLHKRLAIRVFLVEACNQKTQQILRTLALGESLPPGPEGKKVHFLPCSRTYSQSRFPSRWNSGPALYRLFLRCRHGRFWFNLLYHFFFHLNSCFRNGRFLPGNPEHSLKTVYLSHIIILLYPSYRHVCHIVMPGIPVYQRCAYFRHIHMSALSSYLYTVYTDMPQI